MSYFRWLGRRRLALETQINAETGLVSIAAQCGGCQRGVGQDTGGNEYCIAGIDTADAYGWWHTGGHIAAATTAAVKRIVAIVLLAGDGAIVA